jgi:hypothetical protein
MRANLGVVASAYVVPAGGPPFLESFNKADGVGWGPDLTWTETVGTIRTTSNRGTASGSATLNEGRAEHDIGAANMYAQCIGYKNGKSATLDRVRLILRFNAANREHYYFDFRTTNGYDIGHRDSTGALTSITTSPSGVSWSSGDTLMVEVEGSSPATLRMKVNGTTLATTTDSTISGNTRAGAGIIYSGSGAFVSVDDFEAGTL